MKALEAPGPSGTQYNAYIVFGFTGKFMGLDYISIETNNNLGNSFYSKMPKTCNMCEIISRVTIIFNIFIVINFQKD